MINKKMKCFYILCALTLSTVQAQQLVKPMTMGLTLF